MAGILKVDRVQSDSNLAFQIGSANVAYFNTMGLNVTGGEIIAGGSTLRTTTGLIYANSGIALPASQSNSSDPNTFDDYEEGTWSPTFTGSSSAPSSVTYTVQSGRYTKIGRQCHIEFYLRFTAYSGGSGNAVIGGLPFTAAGAPYTGIPLQENLGFTTTGTYYTLTFQVGAGSSTMFLLKAAPNLSTTSVTLGEVGSATTVYVLASGWYTTN
jgi:hypothetical protein